MINVTKTYLPPLRKYAKYLKGIWGRGQITNNGPLVVELEKRLREYLGVKHLFFVSNGTIAIQIAIKALGLKDEVITTPFSYVATTSSIVWENCKPVFADIDEKTLSINPVEIEKNITKKTTGIIGVHVYGNPCDVGKIQKIAKKNKLKVIYDAAHAFGVRHKGKSIMNYGDISTLSFHATKLFHSVEGGAIMTNSDSIAKKISYMRNFGHVGSHKPESFHGLGINGKNSEFHAAMGLCVLDDVKKIITSRKKISRLYDEGLKGLPITRPEMDKHVLYNYAYYPVIFSSKKALMKVFDALRKNNIHPRKYFRPSLNTINYVKGQKSVVSEKMSVRVLCLPLYHGLDSAAVRKICRIIRKTL